MDIQTEAELIVADMVANGEIGPDGDYETEAKALASMLLWLEQRNEMRADGVARHE